MKYDGPCSRCGTVLRAGTPAVWDNRARKMLCLSCAATPTDPAALDLGRAGGSTRAMYERRRSKREAELKDRYGDRLGGLITRFKDEPHSIRAWGLGAAGEEVLGKALDEHYQGTIEVVDRGGFFKTDLRLTVGGRDRSSLADNMEWQVKAVIRALTEAGVVPLPPVTAVLCFVDGNWPLLRAPKSYNGILLESERSLVKRLTAPVHLDDAAINGAAVALSAGLPSQ